MHRIDIAIIKTLCYADIFDFPLREDEIYARYIAHQSISLQTIKRHLSFLHQQGIIEQTNGYYYLPNRMSIVKKRQARYQQSLLKTFTATTIAQKLARLPYVRAIFLTGATAVVNATHQDDIDIFIVSAPKSLWTCRFFAILQLEMLGKRRRPHTKKNSDKICLNLLMAADALSIPSSMQNLYTAHEIVQIKPLYDPHHYEGIFRYVNPWIYHFLPNTPPITNKVNQKEARVSQAPTIIECILRLIQQIYMRSKVTRETITPHSAYFHPKDTGNLVLAKLAKRLTQYIQT